MEDKWWDKRLLKWRLYPHLRVNSCNNGIWKCLYCGKTGTFKEVYATGRTERPKTCIWCGESPLCAPDCTGMQLLLGRPDVYVIGEDPFKDVR